jgi:hypothetical protein
MIRSFAKRPRRLVALLALASALATAGVVLLVGSGGAASDQATTEGISARAVRAAVFSGPTTVDMASVPQSKEGVATGHPQNLKDLSPLGEETLAQAKANAPALAPQADVLVPGAPSTPGLALTGFNGLSDSSTICSYFGAGCAPPDMGLAASDTWVVQAVNTSIAVYNTAGAIQAGFPKSLQAFAGVPAPSPAGCDASHANQPFLSDPRVIYDPVTQRFTVAFLQVEGGFGIATSCNFVSRYWVAVSKTNNPNGAWTVYAFNTANLFSGGNNAADYTLLGFNSQAIFIGGNQFNQAGTAYVGAWTLAIPKAIAEAGGAIGALSGFGGYTASDGTATRLLDTVQPVNSFGDGFGGPATEFMIASFNESVTESKVVVMAFSNPLKHQGQGQKLTAVVIPTKSYSQPPLADNYPACTNCLETIDNRISGTPVYMHGNIYATHDTAVNNGTSTNANQHWMIVAPVLNQLAVAGCTECGAITTATRVVQDQYLTYSGTTDDWFGVIQPDREGNVFMAYEYGSTSGQVSPSSVYIARRATASATASWGDGGFFLKQATTSTSNSRWGDYEAAGFAGWNGNYVWFGTEFAGANHDWSTHIDKVNYQTLAQK